MRRSLIIGSVCALVLLSVGVVGTVSGQGSDIDVQGSPEIEVFLSDNEVTPGSETSITVTANNNGELKRGREANRDIVTTARSATATLDNDGTPIEVVTKKQAIGSITEDSPTNAEFDIKIPDSAQGSYDLEV